MGGGTVEVYCDGSVTDTIWTDIFTSARGSDLVARSIVLIPDFDFDFGLIQQTRHGMVTRRGTSDSTAAETFAVRTALDVCNELGIVDYVVVSDCQGAVHRFSDERVEWRSREKMRMPNDFFDKVLRRAAYLRASHGKVVNRRPPQPHQREAFELLTLRIASSASPPAHCGCACRATQRHIQQRSGSFPSH